MNPLTILSDSSFSNCNFYSLLTNNLDGNFSNWKICVDGVITINNSLYSLQMYQRGQRILVIGQTNKIDNGIYTVNNGHWKRSNDMKAGIAASGAITYCYSDNFYYYCINDKDNDIVGINELTFEKIVFDETYYSNDRVIVKENNILTTKELYVVGQNSLRFAASLSGNDLTLKTFLPNNVLLKSNSFYNNMVATQDINISTNSAFKGSNIVFDYDTYVYTLISASQSHINFNTNDNQSVYIGPKNIEFTKGGVNLNVTSNDTINFGETISVLNQGTVTIVNDGGVAPLSSAYIILNGVIGSCYACIQKSDNYFNVSTVSTFDGLKVVFTNMLNTTTVNSTNGTTVGFVGL